MTTVLCDRAAESASAPPMHLAVASALLPEHGMIHVSPVQVRRSARLNGGLAQPDDDASLSALGAMRNAS